MTRTQRTSLAVVLALGFLASLSAWMQSGSTANASPAAAPLTRAQYLEQIGCNANGFSTATWVAVERGQAQVGMGYAALACALGAPDDVRTITTANRETVFHSYQRDGQRPLVVQISDGLVSSIAD